MPLPTLAKLKGYLRIENTSQDEVLTDILSEAVAWAQSLIGIPITAEARTFYNVRPVFVGEGVGYGLALPVYPVASAALAVTDVNGDAVAGANFRIDNALGWLVPITTYSFADDDHTIVATVGLSAHPRYATEKEPLVNALILGLASVLHHERNPNASSQSEAGASVSYRDEKLPPRLQSLVSRLRPIRL